MVIHAVKFSSELVAPYGMNCALCSEYLALKYDVKSKGIRIPYCEGCRIEKRNVRSSKRDAYCFWIIK